MSLFKTFEMLKDDKIIILPEVLQNKVICKKAISKGLCKESRGIYYLYKAKTKAVNSCIFKNSFSWCGSFLHEDICSGCLFESH